MILDRRTMQKRNTRTTKGSWIKHVTESCKSKYHTPSLKVYVRTASHLYVHFYLPRTKEHFASTFAIDIHGGFPMSRNCRTSSMAMQNIPIVVGLKQLNYPPTQVAIPTIVILRACQHSRVRRSTTSLRFFFRRNASPGGMTLRLSEQ